MKTVNDEAIYSNDKVIFSFERFYIGKEIMLKIGIRVSPKTIKSVSCCFVTFFRLNKSRKRYKLSITKLFQSLTCHKEKTKQTRVSTDAGKELLSSKTG